MAILDDYTAPPTYHRLAREHVYVRTPRPIEFPECEPAEEEVSESKRHLENRTALYLVLKELLAATSSVGSEQFVYYNPADAHQCLSPDEFVKLGVPDRPFRVWKTWEHGAPDLGVEIISDSDHRDVDWNEKLARYRAAGIRELVRFDADDDAHPIRIWDHVSGDLVERAGGDPDLHFCHTLGLWWIVLEDVDYGPMLRLARDREGRDPLPTPTEGRVLAEMAYRAAQQALIVAEHEKLLAEQAAQREAEARRDAEQARHDAEQARRAAEQARRDAEQARHDAEQAQRHEAEARRDAESEIERLKAALAQARRGH